MSKGSRLKRQRRDEEETVLQKASWNNVHRILRECEGAITTAAAGSKLLIDRARADSAPLPNGSANTIIELARSIASIQNEIKALIECIPPNRGVIDADNYPHYLALMDRATDVFMRISDEVAPRIQSLTQTFLTEEELNNG